MNANKKTARLVGAFYILATVAGILGIAVTDSTLTASDYLTKVAADDNQILLGALFELIMAVAVVGIAVSIYPVLKEVHASIGIGYFAERLVEAVIFIVDVTILLSLLTLSREFVKAETPDTAYFHTLGDLLFEARDWLGHVTLDVAVFPLGALILYAAMYQTKLVPRWLAGWGLIGAVMSWSAGLLVMFELITPLETPHLLLQAPIGIQEMVFAVWLIVKGFIPSATLSTAETA